MNPAEIDQKMSYFNIIIIIIIIINLFFFTLFIFDLFPWLSTTLFVTWAL